MTQLSNPSTTSANRMSRFRPVVVPLVVAVLGATQLPTRTAAAQSSGATKPLPVTGIDFSGVDEFWKIVDVLRQDVEPTDRQWRDLLGAPGYRLAMVNLGSALKDDINLTFRPSRHAEFVRAAAGDGERALQLRHIALALAERSDLQAYRDSLSRTTPIADAVALAATLLPRGATTTGPPPLVAFAIFKDDGYTLPEGIVIDLLYARVSSVGGSPLTWNLGHEFHHAYVNRLAGSRGPLSMDERMAGSDGDLRQALYDLRNEGIADQIDKPYPLAAHTQGLRAYADRYNREYARTPETMRSLDSLLTILARDSSTLAAVSSRISGVFWSNGHPNGAYIAREIRETFGDDSLRAASLDPAIFLVQFAAAEKKRGRPAPFSADAMRAIDWLDAKYWRVRFRTPDPMTDRVSRWDSP